MARDINMPLDAVGYQQITGMTTSTSLVVPQSSTFAIIQAEAQNVRWRPDAIAPTATVGMILFAGDDMIYTSDLQKFRVIEMVSGAKLNVSYFK
jgi:hypothetical protein